MVKKIYQFFFNGFRLEPIILLRFLLSFVTGTKPITVPSYAEEELLNAVASGKSIIRMGDGEVMLLMGRDIHFQPYSPALKTTLHHIIADYSADAPYVIGAPIDQLAATDQELKYKERMRIWRLFRIYFPLRFPQKVKYCSLVLFYHQNTFEHKIAEVLKNRHVICVGNEKVLDEKLRSYFTTNFPQASFVTAPGYDAFSEFDSITQEIETALTTHPTLSPTILIAIGPASKAIAYTFAKRGVQTLDIGHGMEIISRDINYASRI